MISLVSWLGFLGSVHGQIECEGGVLIIKTAPVDGGPQPMIIEAPTNMLHAPRRSGGRPQLGGQLPGAQPPMQQATMAQTQSQSYAQQTSTSQAQVQQTTSMSMTQAQQSSSSTSQTHVRPTHQQQRQQGHEHDPNQSRKSPILTGQTQQKPGTMATGRGSPTSAVGVSTSASGTGMGMAGGASPSSAAASGTAASSSAPSSSSTASGSSAPAAGGTSGTATYYTFWSTSPGSCGSIPTDPMIVAVPPNLGKAACGKCVTVNYQGKSIKVKVTDTCADCDPTHIDLSNTAFEKLAPLGAGKISVTWSIGAC